jgi:putative methyltransferase (TIGR04325 family)
MRRTVKERVRSWLPPGALRLVRRARTWVGTPPFEVARDGWRTSPEKVRGWNDPSVAEAERGRWPAFVQALEGTDPVGVNHEAEGALGRRLADHNVVMSYGYALALASGGRPRLSVLDWGGGLGHYYLFSQALLPGVELDYTCQDLPGLCATGRELLPGVRFLDEPGACFGRTYDFVLASGSLWYEEDWRRLGRLLAKASDGYLYISRMIFASSHPSFVAVQRPGAAGYRTEYLFWVLNRGEFLAEMAGAGMELVREFFLGDGPWIRGAPEQGDFQGFLFRRPAGGPRR